MKLNDGEIKQIKDYLKKSKVENRLIQEDFFDHICCMVEKHIEDGYSFEESMKLVIEAIPYSEIKNTESFTLKLLNMETSFSTRTSLLATIPFLLLGFEWMISSSGLPVPSFIQFYILVIPVLSMFVLLGVGWIKDFPRWSFPAIGFCIFFSLFFTMVRVPVLGSGLMGLWAFVPLLITIVVCILFKPSFKPLKSIIDKIYDDPSLILFVLYGFAPFITFAFFDEIYSVWMIPASIIITIILSIGFYVFLKSGRKKVRIWSIILPLPFILVIAYLASYLYWP